MQIISFFNVKYQTVGWKNTLIGSLHEHVLYDTENIFTTTYNNTMNKKVAFVVSVERRTIGEHMSIIIVDARCIQRR